ncbi:MAG: hypothetical protein FWF47_08320, partial [Clostridia bacterium]|nr:hypothetical protein [Clostridia bacterium]
MARKIAAFILCFTLTGWMLPVKTTFLYPDSPQYAVPTGQDEGSSVYASGYEETQNPLKETDDTMAADDTDSYNKQPDSETIIVPESERHQENFEMPPETNQITAPSDADDSHESDETAKLDDTTDEVPSPEPEHNTITEVKLGVHEPVKAIPGRTITLAFPVQVVDGEDTYDSNRSAEGRI